MNRTTHRPICAPRRQRGTGLVEVLVAVLVLSFGMLGLAGLQMSALKNNQSSLERGMAVVQTHSIADAMRADRTTAINGGFDLALNDEAPTDNTFAAVSLATWRTNLINVLGSAGTGQVDCDGSLCTIIVQWNDERGTGGSTTQQISTQVQL